MVDEHHNEINDDIGTNGVKDSDSVKSLTMYELEETHIMCHVKIMLKNSPKSVISSSCYLVSRPESHKIKAHANFAMIVRLFLVTTGVPQVGTNNKTIILVA